MTLRLLPQEGIKYISHVVVGKVTKIINSIYPPMIPLEAFSSRAGVFSPSAKVDGTSGTTQPAPDCCPSPPHFHYEQLFSWARTSDFRITMASQIEKETEEM